MNEQKKPQGAAKPAIKAAETKKPEAKKAEATKPAQSPTAGKPGPAKK